MPIIFIDTVRLRSVVHLPCSVRRPSVVVCTGQTAICIEAISPLAVGGGTGQVRGP